MATSLERIDCRRGDRGSVPVDVSTWHTRFDSRRTKSLYILIRCNRSYRVRTNQFFAGYVYPYTKHGNDTCR